MPNPIVWSIDVPIKIVAFLRFITKNIVVLKPTASYYMDYVSEYLESNSDLGAWSWKTMSNFLYGKERRRNYKMIAPIRTKADYKKAMSRIEELSDKDCLKSKDELEELSFLITEYENKNFEIRIPDKAEVIKAIKFMMKL